MSSSIFDMLESNPNAAADFQVNDITSILLSSQEPILDDSTDPPTQSFFLRRIISPRGQRLAVGTQIVAYANPEPNDPIQTQRMMFRGLVSEIIVVDGSWAHLQILPRPPVGWESHFPNLVPPINPPLRLYTNRYQTLVPRSTAFWMRTAQCLHIRRRPFTPPQPTNPSTHSPSSYTSSGSYSSNTPTQSATPSLPSLSTGSLHTPSQDDHGH